MLLRGWICHTARQVSAPSLIALGRRCWSEGGENCRIAQFLVQKLANGIRCRRHTVQRSLHIGEVGENVENSTHNVEPAANCVLLCRTVLEGVNVSVMTAGPDLQHICQIEGYETY